MHILISVFFHAPLGGLHDNVLSTALHCQKQQHEVTVVCKEGIFANKLRDSGIRVIATDFSSDSYPAVVQEVLHVHQNSPIHIIHAHPFLSRKLSVLLAQLLEIPLFITMHGRYTDHLDRHIENVSIVFTVSEGIKDFLGDRLRSQIKFDFMHKMTVIPNGVNRQLFVPARKNSAHNRTLNISFITRLDQDKAFVMDIFYKALRFTANEFPDRVRWTIVGDGALRSEVEDRAARITDGRQLVRFAGWKEQEDLRQEYVESDIILAPGRCALEGMSCGKPVIAVGSKGYTGLISKDDWLKGVYSNFGGIGNKIEDYEEGTVVSAVDLN